VRLLRYSQTGPFMVAEVETLEDVQPVSTAGVEALVRNVIGQFQQIVSESQTLSDELRTIAANIEEPSRMVDFVASSLPFLTTDDKQLLLETASISDRLELLNKHLAKEIEVQQLRAKIQTEVQDQVQQSQRDYYLREQLKAIQKELGDVDEGQREIEDLRQKIEAAGMPEDVKKEAVKELARLSRMSPWQPTTRSPQLHRMAGDSALEQELRLQDRHCQGQGDSGRGPLRTEEGEGPGSGLPERAGPEAGYEGADPLLRRAAGCSKTSLGRSIARALAASSSASRWAACTTRRRFAAIAALTSALFRARSSKASAAPRSMIR